jgi:hypothetical protein
LPSISIAPSARNALSIFSKIVNLDVHIEVVRRVILVRIVAQMMEPAIDLFIDAVGVQLLKFKRNPRRILVTDTEWQRPRFPALGYQLLSGVEERPYAGRAV